MLNMNNLDLGLLIASGIFALLGIYWGLIRQVLSIAGLILGVVLAGSFGAEVAVWLSSFIPEPNIAGVVGFSAVFMLVSTLASLAASLLRVFVGLLFLGWLDHLLGGILGLIQAVLAGTTILIVLIAFPAPLWSPLVETSVLAGGLVRIGQVFMPLLPNMFDLAVEQFLGGR